MQIMGIVMSVPISTKAVAAKEAPTASGTFLKTFENERVCVRRLMVHAAMYVYCTAWLGTGFSSQGNADRIHTGIGGPRASPVTMPSTGMRLYGSRDKSHANSSDSTKPWQLALYRFCPGRP